MELDSDSEPEMNIGPDDANAQEGTTSNQSKSASLIDPLSSISIPPAAIENDPELLEDLEIEGSY